jgi:hypothetical protein
MDVSFTGMIILLFFITAGPLLLVLGGMAFLFSKFQKKPFRITIIPALIIFIPVHSLILFWYSPVLLVDLGKIVETVLISLIYVGPIFIFIYFKKIAKIIKHRIKNKGF